MDLISLSEVDMFDKAKEIQSLVDKPRDLEFDHFNTGWDKYGRAWFKKSGNHLVWIPYQEDLQIIANHKSPREFERVDFIISQKTDPYLIRVLLSRFNNFVDRLLLNQAIMISPYLSQFCNIRELWLAFAMQEQYNKVWHHGNWQKVEVKDKEQIKVGEMVKMPIGVLPEKLYTGHLNLLISLHKQFRKVKQWLLADKIRIQLGKAGILLEDSPKETVWKGRQRVN